MPALEHPWGVEQPMHRHRLAVVIRPPTESQMPDPRRDIAAALAEAARAINSPRTLEDTLDAIAGAAQRNVPGFDEAGISIVHRDGSVQTRAGTGRLVWHLDHVQSELGEGPLVDGLREKPVVVVARLAGNERWPRYVAEAVDVGVRSQLVVQLYVEEDTVGGLTLYSTSSDTISREAHRFAELFAVHAALALGRARRESQLSEALATRKVIGQAIGLLMARYRISEERAFQFLVRASSTSNTKLRDIAREVVREADREYAEGEAP
jgi:transcriptional regulator with GAF, ATPase, and Fis domain